MPVCQQSRLLDSYVTFDDSVWSYHAVEMPWQLAKNFTEEIVTLNDRAFFYP